MITLIGCTNNKEVIVKTETIYSEKIVKCKLPDVEPIDLPKKPSSMTVNELGIQFKKTLISLEMANNKLISVKKVCGTK